MGYTWRYQRKDGTEVLDLPDEAVTDDFPSQADAESWLGETWRELLRGGVDAVTLMSDASEVYGPMSLHPPE